MTTSVPVYALDFETYFSLKERVSVTTLGIKAYIRHPKFEATVVSVLGDDGFEFVGHPSEFDWNILCGKHVISHNASFDASIYHEGVALGWWPEVAYHQWDCTADLCAYHGIPRSLAGAAKCLYNEEVSKSVRASMSGKEFSTLTPEEKEELFDYALGDVHMCLRFWKTLAASWPEQEARISRHTRQVTLRGIPVNERKISDALDCVGKEIHARESIVPWSDTAKIFSQKALAQACRDIGIDPPKSMNKKDPETIKWVAQHGDKAPFIRAISELRTLNSLQERLRKLRDSVIDGRASFGLMYSAAHTRRWGGGGGAFNGQNMNSTETFGINLRHVIEAPPGKTFIIADLSQIEVRVLLYLAGDKRMLDKIREHDDIYQAFAEEFGMWDSSKGRLRSDPTIRKLVKAIVLGCGFSAYPNAFASMSGMSIQEATHAVHTYRTSMRRVVAFWEKCVSAAKSYDGSRPQIRTVDGKLVTVPADSTYRVKLPSGNVLNYRNHRLDGEDVLAEVMTPKGFRTARLWAGVLSENATQATARDVFAEKLLEIENTFPGSIIYHVHDEVILEVPDSDVDAALDRVTRILSSPPDWCRSLPLACEAHASKLYDK